MTGNDKFNAPPPHNPIDLDDRRDMVDRKVTEIRRDRPKEFQDGQKAQERRQHELETWMLATPAVTWSAVATKAQYIIQRYAASPEGREPRCKQLIEQVLSDLRRLSERGEPPGPPARQ